MSSNTSLHSNAFNFMSFFLSQVDPRTGQFTHAISLPELKANYLCGPVVPLQLFFNPLNNRDSGFGRGWNLQLSQFDPATGMLSLYTGESFKVLLGGELPVIPEKKLDSFHFHEQMHDGKPAYRVEHKSGLVEILQVRQGGLALPVQLRSAQGHHVTLEYESFGTDPLLGSIANADGSQLLSVVRRDTLLELTLHPGTAFEARFVLNILGGLTKSLVLPTDDQASWRFEYVPKDGLSCLEQVWTPTGGHEKVTYSGVSHSLPGLGDRKVPRVEKHVSAPGFQQPAIETHYEYDTSGANFLGYGSGVSWSDDGLDNLNKDGVARGYTYETSEILWDAVGKRAIRKIHRVFNRAHLQVLEETTQYSTDPQQDHAYCKTESAYYFDPQLNFADQVAYCQMPKSVTQTWHYLNATVPRHEETTTTTYDDYGNLLSQTDPSGVTQTHEWYASAGERDPDGTLLCPPDPQGFVRSLKSTTVTPAASQYGDAPTLKTNYRYAIYQGLRGAGPWLVLRDETLVHLGNDHTQTEMRQIAHEYFDLPKDPVRHGQASRTTQTLHGEAATRNITEYTYEHTPANALRTVSRLIGFDDAAKTPVRKVVTKEHLLLGGWGILNKDDDLSEVIYTHDKLGRLTEETAAPDTDYVAQRFYTYSLTNGASGQQAMQSSTDVKGTTTRTWLDGFNRVLKVELQDVEGWGGDPEAYRLTYKATYNNREQLVSKTTVDWDGERDIESTVTYEYNVWGEQSRITGADGVVQVMDSNPATQTFNTWIETSTQPIETMSRIRTQLNRFGKEESSQKLDTSGKMVSERLYRYDGLGNCVEQVDEMGETTRFRYDLFTRLHATVLPDTTVVRRTYADHSPSDLPSELSVDTGEETIVVGTQKFDGLGRRTSVQVGPRVQQFKYLGGRSLVSEMITASNRIITYEYTPGLVGYPVESIAPDEQAIFNYDPQNAQLKTSSNNQGVHAFDYSFTGSLRHESWEEPRSGKKWSTRYSHTLQGRLLSRLDTNGLLCNYTYDDETSQLRSITQGQLSATFTYNRLGQSSVISTLNKTTGQTLKTTLAFDHQGRETTRVMQMDGHPERTISQTYRADSKLHTRHLQVAGQTELFEKFDYDSRGRMVEYICEGTALPKDRYGNAIKLQYYLYDALDNITYLYSQFADDTSDEAYSKFSDQDRCQLVQVTHSHPDYPATVALEYDLDGNVLHDEHGQTLHYDTQGRLMCVTAADGSLVSQYRYDAHNHLLGVTRGTQAETMRFYEGQRLSRTEQNGKHIHYLYGNQQPLGQQEQGQPEQTLLLMTDGKNTVLAEGDGHGLRKATYGAYGEIDHNDDFQCLLGFNGEVRDELSGWYLLGKGYRVYNPSLMRFFQPDPLSPFGAGGINCYMYCTGDPINFVDPTGHANRGVNWTGIQGILLAIAGIGLSIAAIVIAPPVSALGVMTTVGFESVGLVFAGIGIKDGVEATTAATHAEREAAGQRSLTSGLYDVGFGAFGVFMAYRAAAQVAKATVISKAQESFNAKVKTDLSEVDELLGRDVTTQLPTPSSTPPGSLPNSRRGSVDSLTETLTAIPANIAPVKRVPPPVPPRPRRKINTETVDVSPAGIGQGGFGKKKWGFKDLQIKQANFSTEVNYSERVVGATDQVRVLPEESIDDLRGLLAESITNSLNNPK